jgi:hypothetical protein
MLMRIAVMALLVAGAACDVGARSVGTRTTTLMRAPSGKTLAVYRSPSFESQGRAVPEAVVVHGMRASSLFFEEDIRALAPAIATGLTDLDEDERLVVETSDTAIHVFVAAATGDLQVVGFRRGHEISRHTSAIPGEPVKTELATKPRPAAAAAAPATAAPATAPASASLTEAAAETPAPPPPRPAPAEAPAPTTASPTGTTEQPAVKPRAAKPKPATPLPRRLSAEEIRNRLDELDRLRAKGLITEREYQQRRKALLDQL